jgi:hypothetical protein
MLLITENCHDIGANAGVIPVRIHDDAGHQMLENGDRLMDCPLRGDKLPAAGDASGRGVGLHVRCVEGGKVVEPVVVDRGEDPRDHAGGRAGPPACGGPRVEDRRLEGRLRRAGGHRVGIDPDPDTDTEPAGGGMSVYGQISELLRSVLSAPR